MMTKIQWKVGIKTAFLGIIKSALDLIKGAESDTHTAG